MIGPLFATIAPAPVVRPVGVREVVAPCGCRLLLSRSWVGELARTTKACPLKAAGRTCDAGRGGWE